MPFFTINPTVLQSGTANSVSGMERSVTWADDGTLEFEYAVVGVVGAPDTALRADDRFECQIAGTTVWKCPVQIGKGRVTVPVTSGTKTVRFFFGRATAPGVLALIAGSIGDVVAKSAAGVAIMTEDWSDESHDTAIVNQWSSLDAAFHAGWANHLGRFLAYSTANVADFTFNPVVAYDTPSDVTAPTVTLVSPANGTSITPTTPLVVDITDAVAFRRVMLALSVSTHSLYEVVHDGDGFASLYSAGSTRTAISNGYRYSIVRTGGIPASPSLKIFAIDTSGNEAS